MDLETVSKITDVGLWATTITLGVAGLVFAGLAIKAAYRLSNSYKRKIAI